MRNLNFAVSKSIIVEDIAKSGLIAMDTLVEVRVARVGRAACWQGNEKMCSAFVIFNSPTAAQLLGNHWHGKEHRVIGGFKPLECKIEICPAVPQQTQQQQEHSFPQPPPPPPVPPQLDATTTASTDNTTTSSQPCKNFKNNLTSKGPPPHSAVWQATKHSVGPCPSPIQGGFFGFRDLMPPPPRPLDEVFRRLGGSLPRNSLPNTPPAEPTRHNDAQKKKVAAEKSEHDGRNKKDEKDEKQEVEPPQDETKKDDDDDQDKEQEVKAPQDETKKDEDDDPDKKQKVEAPQDEPKKEDDDEKDEKQEVEPPQDEAKKDDDDDQDKEQEVEAPQDETKKDDDDDQDKKQAVEPPQDEAKKDDDDDDDSEDDGEEPNNNLQNGRVRVKLETKSEASEERDLLPVVGPAAEPDEEERPTETPSYNGDEEGEASSAHFDPYQGLSDFEVDDEEKEAQNPWKRRALKRQELLYRQHKKAHVQQQKKKEKKYDERKGTRKEFTGLLCEGWSENVGKVQRVWSSI